MLNQWKCINGIMKATEIDLIDLKNLNRTIVRLPRNSSGNNSKRKSFKFVPDTKLARTLYYSYLKYYILINSYIH